MLLVDPREARLQPSHPADINYEPKQPGSIQCAMPCPSGHSWQRTARMAARLTACQNIKQTVCTHWLQACGWVYGRAKEGGWHLTRFWWHSDLQATSVITNATRHHRGHHKRHTSSPRAWSRAHPHLCLALRVAEVLLRCGTLAYFRNDAISAYCFVGD